ncbi:hypothetical protein AB0J82_39110 [Asanoa sp. NPDC049518]|uniref:hypothetical protein n=1 Tax=unclassified Asanoa TaxID=2685164 RepID=UPI00343676E1
MEMTASTSQEQHDGRQPGGRTLEILTSVAAQGAALGAVLYFYGFARTQSLYRYLGVDMTLLSMSPPDLMLRSLNALVIPAVLLAIATIAGRLVMAASSVATGKFRHTADAALAVCGVAGLTLALAGRWLSSPETRLIPVWTVVGITMVLGTITGWLFRVAEKGSQDIQLDDRASRAQSLHDRLRSTARTTLVATAVFVLLTVGAFAELNGQQDADALQRGLKDAPKITLYADKDLAIPVKPGGSASADRYGFAYENLRLIIRANGRYFLVTPAWTRGQPVFVVNDDEHVRLDINASPRPAVPPSITSPVQSTPDR